MINIFQVSHILQFILRFQVQYSEWSINSAVWQMLHCFLPIRLQIFLRVRDKHN